MFGIPFWSMAYLFGVVVGWMLGYIIGWRRGYAAGDNPRRRIGD